MTLQKDIKIFNTLSEMVRTPDATFSDFMCTDYRKPVVDPFHKELLKTQTATEANSDADIGIMLYCGGGYPFERVSEKKELRLIPEFESFQGKKIDVSEYMMEMDLQIFRTLPAEYMFYKKGCDLLHHPQMDKGWLSVFNERYIEDRSKKSCFIENAIRSTQPNWLMIPVNAFDLIEDSGLLLENESKLINAKVSFVPFLPAVADEVFVNVDQLKIDYRPYDCFLAGSANAFVYPFRHMAFKKIAAVAEKKGWVISKESRNEFKSSTIHFQKDFEAGLISKNQLDLEIQKISEMQYLDYFKKASESKLAIVCSSVFGYPLKKYFEYMASGCVVVGDMPKNAGRYGFRHMENVFECQIDEVEEAVDFLLKNDELRLKIATNALKLMQDKYTMKSRVDLLFNQIRDIANKHL